MVKPEIVRELEANVGFPAVSILLETHRTSPDNKRDPIALKNLVTEAEVRLAEVLDKRQAEPLIIRLRDLAASINHEHNTEGLGLFVGLLTCVPSAFLTGSPPGCKWTRRSPSAT